MAWRSLLLIALLILSPSAAADIIHLFAFDSGHYYPDGTHFASNRNYQVGEIGQDPIRLRNFFLFNVGWIEQPILSATLRLDPGVIIGADWFNLTDLTIDPDIVRADHAAGDPHGQAVYGDLITGFSYGTAFVSEQDTVIDIELNHKALLDLNDSSGIFGIGGYMRPGSDAAAFLNTADFRPRLIIETVPEPSSLVLLLSAIASMLLFTRRAIAGASTSGYPFLPCSISESPRDWPESSAAP